MVYLDFQPSSLKRDIVVALNDPFYLRCSILLDFFVRDAPKTSKTSADQFYTAADVEKKAIYSYSFEGSFC